VSGVLSTDLVGAALFVCVLLALVRGRAFVVVDEFVFWAKVIFEKAHRRTTLKKNLLMICSSD
jgi:uncharacterized membrane-anchored protein